MILDADSTTCQKATFNIGPSTSTSRSWEIKVTQYGCGNEDRAGIYSKSALILLCLIILVECPTNFEFGTIFSIVVYALN